jgi:hypothetical protein
MNSVHTTHSYSSKIHFNIIVTPNLRFSSGVYFYFAPKHCIQFSSVPCYMPCPSHPPWLDNSNYTWRTVQVMKLPIMQFSLTSYHFIPLRSKYSPQHPVLKHPQSMFLP